jgi:hypothetical protein
MERNRRVLKIDRFSFLMDVYIHVLKSLMLLKISLCKLPEVITEDVGIISHEYIAARVEENV